MPSATEKNQGGSQKNGELPLSFDKVKESKRQIMG